MTSKVPRSTNCLVNWSVTSLQMSAVPKGVWTNRLTSCSGKVRRDLLICDDCQALRGGFRACGLARPPWLRLDSYGLRGLGCDLKNRLTFLGVANDRADGARRRRLRDKLFMIEDFMAFLK